MSTATIALIGAITTIFAGFGGAFLGAYLSYKVGIKLVQKTHKNDIKLFRRQEFNMAASEFRATFVDEIFHIRDSIETIHAKWGIRPRDIVIANEKAKIIFGTFLSGDILSGFNTAWDKYISPEEINKKIYSPLNPEHRKELGNIRLSHIKNLLEFANPKL